MTSVSVVEGRSYEGVSTSTLKLLLIPKKKLRHAGMGAQPPLYTSTCRNSRKHHHLEIPRHVMLPFTAKFCEVRPVSEHICGRVSEYDLHVSRDSLIIGRVPLALVCHRELPSTASLTLRLLEFTTCKEQIQWPTV